MLRCTHDVIVWNLKTNTTIRIDQWCKGDVHLINNDKNILCGFSNGLKLLNIEDGALIDTVVLDHDVGHIKIGGSSFPRDSKCKDPFGGHFCVTASTYYDGSFSLVNLDTLSVVWQKIVGNHIVALSTPRYDRVAFGLVSGKVAVWNLSSGERIGTDSIRNLNEGWGRLNLLEFLQEDQLISSNLEGITFVWSPEKVSKQPHKNEKEREPMVGLAVSADESFVATRHSSGSITIWDAKQCCHIFSVSTDIPSDWIWSMSSTRKYVAYCSLGITREKIFTFTTEKVNTYVTAHFRLIGIQKQEIVAATTIHANAHLNNNNSNKNNVELKFVEDHFILRYKWVWESSYCYVAFKIISTDNSVSLQNVECKGQWKFQFNFQKDTSRKDKAYYRNRFLYTRDEDAPDFILATVPHKPAHRCPTYFNEETGIFIARMENGEIISLKIHK